MTIWKSVYKLIKAMYGKAMKNLGNRINVKLVNNKKDYLKFISKSSYMSHKIFHNSLEVIQKGNWH